MGADRLHGPLRTLCPCLLAWPIREPKSSETRFLTLTQTVRRAISPIPLLCPLLVIFSSFRYFFPSFFCSLSHPCLRCRQIDLCYRMLPHSARAVHAASPQARWTRLISARRPQVITTRPHLHPRISTRFITTDDPASGESARNEPFSHPSTTFTVRQRKSGTWLPKWMTLTMSKDHGENSFSFQPSPTTKGDTTNGDSDEKTVEQLLSPQTALAVFLPKGFPDSVTPNYWPYAKWQFVHNVTGSVSAGE